MSRTQMLDTSGGVRVVDSQTNAPDNGRGTPDLAETDFLQVTINGSSREVVIEGKNENETDDHAPIRIVGEKTTVAAKTADYTIKVSDSGKTFTTVGAGGTVTFALPAAVVGLNYRFRVGAAQELRLDPNGTETIALPSTGVASASGKYITANADGETVAIECTKAGEWSVFGYTGTWTAEA